MLLACIADDLTGATDLGVTLAREGLSVVQVNGVPEASLAAPEADAVVVAGKSLEDAVYNAEEMEETAKLYLLLTGRDARYLDAAQIADLEAQFPS